MKVKTQQLLGAALDWAVAKCEGVDSAAACYYDTDGTPVRLDEAEHAEWQPTTNWAQGGPIIEREKLCLLFDVENDCENDPPGWLAEKEVGPLIDGNYLQVFGATPLIAALRCYVASKLGDELEVPDELLKT